MLSLPSERERGLAPTWRTTSQCSILISPTMTSVVSPPSSHECFADESLACSKQQASELRANRRCLGGSCSDRSVTRASQPVPSRIASTLAAAAIVERSVPVPDRREALTLTLERCVDGAWTVRGRCGVAVDRASDHVGVGSHHSKGVSRPNMAKSERPGDDRSVADRRNGALPTGRKVLYRVCLAAVGSGRCET